jgi:O-antigen ligase
MALATPRGLALRAERPLVAALLVLLVGVGCGALAALVNPIYAVGGVVAALAAVVVASSRRLSFLAFLAVATLLPFAVLPVSIGGIKPTLIDATVTLLLVTWLLGLVTRRESWRDGTPLDTPLALFVAVSFAAFVLGTAYAVTAEGTRQYFKLVNSTLFFFTVTQLVRTRRDLEGVVLSLVAGGALSAAIGATLYHLPASTATGLLRALRPLGYPAGDVLRYVEDAGVRTETLRAIGTSVDPNVYGALLLLTGVLAVGGYLATTGRVRRLHGAAALVIGYALLITLSRGSWVGFAAAVTVMVARRYRRIALALPPLVIAALLLAGGEVERFGEHFLKAVYAQDQATGMRLGEYKDALNLIQQYPLLGIGFGGAPSSDLYLGVSSTYLLIAEEMGLVGLGLFLVVAWRAIRVGWRGAGDPLALTCLAAFVGLLVAALFDRHYFDLRFPHVAALLWLTAALVTLSSRPEPADNAEGG